MGLYLWVGCGCPWLCWGWTLRGPGAPQSQGQVGVRRGLPLLFSMSPLFCPDSVLVPLIRSTKEMTK